MFSFAKRNTLLLTFILPFVCLLAIAGYAGHVILRLKDAEWQAARAMAEWAGLRQAATRMFTFETRLEPRLDMYDLRVPVDELEEVWRRRVEGFEASLAALEQAAPRRLLGVGTTERLSRARLVWGAARDDLEQAVGMFREIIATDLGKQLSRLTYADLVEAVMTGVARERYSSRDLWLFYRLQDKVSGLDTSGKMLTMLLDRTATDIHERTHRLIHSIVLVALGLSVLVIGGAFFTSNRIEKTIRENEERYRAVFSGARDGIALVDAATGRFIECNEGFERISGRSLERLRQLKVWDIRAPEDTAMVKQTFAAIRSQGAVAGGGPDFVKPDGRRTPIEFNARLIHVAGRPMVLSVVRDVTERRRSEEALRRSEARYRALSEYSAVGVWHMDADGRTVYVNPTLRRFLEIDSIDEVQGQAFERFFTPESLEAVRREHKKRERGEATTYEIEIVGAKGTRRNVLLCGAPLMSADGTLEGKIGTFIDVTELKRAEDERRVLESKIQHTQKLESLGILAGGIAHDFNNILMSILGYADLALMDVSPSSHLRGYLKEIETASRRAADLCQQMLAYSGKGRFIVEPIDLRDLIKEITHLLEVSISKKAVLRYKFSEDLPRVRADATQLRQVLMNLVVNASEAIGERSGVITLTTGVMECDRDYLRETWLDEDLPEGRYVFFEVSDTGCGMDAETKAKVFDPFFTTKFTGRGLGMAAVLGIVRGHSGAIKLYSQLGDGTTFKVLLPADESGEAAPRRTGEEAPRDWTGAGTVLLVDDEPAVRQVARSMLERLGFETIEAGDGREAVDAYRERADDIVCVLLDLTMPHMGGEETFRELRRVRADVRVILSSGYNEQEITQRFAGKGLAGFIQKPYQLDALRRVLRDILG